MPPRRSDAWRWAVPLAIGGVLWALPVPDGLAPAAWRYVAVFAFVVAALVTEPLPGPAVGVLGVTTAAVLGLVGETPAEALRWALSGFSNDVVWLIFAATTFALGYELTGLGRRIALVLVRAFGRRTLGLGYAIALADLVLAPFMPSNTARSAGTIFPVVRNIPPLYGSTPEREPRAIGAYLSWTAFASTTVTSSMFVTAMAPNLLATEMARSIAGVEITWTSWAAGFLPIGVPLFLLTPLVAYFVYPPSITRGDRVVDWASGELAVLGRMSGREILMGLLALVALALWIAGGAFIAGVTVALAVITLMLLAGIVTWNDIASNRQGWSVLVWFATLVTLADGLRAVGFLEWFASWTAAGLAGWPVMATAVMAVAAFFVLHYLFASTTAHTTAVLPVFLAAIVAIGGMPVAAVVPLLVYSLGLMGVLTPYGTGPAPIWYSTGYISPAAFWTLGAVMGALYLAGLLVIGFPLALGRS
jgi:L-tartrate/succinate antiporter